MEDFEKEFMFNMVNLEKQSISELSVPNVEQIEDIENYVLTWASISDETKVKYPEFFTNIIEIFKTEQTMVSTIVSSTPKELWEKYPYFFDIVLAKGIDEKNPDIFYALYFKGKTVIKDLYPEKFQKLIGFLNENPEYLAQWYNPLMHNEFSIENYVEGVNALKKDGKSVITKLNFGLHIKIEDIEKLDEWVKDIHGLPEGENFRVILRINNISELSLEQLEHLCGLEGSYDKLNINVEMDEASLASEQREPYNVNELYVCKVIIKSLLEGIYIGEIEDIDREKKIFGQVIKRLAYHMSFDYDYTYERGKLVELKELMETASGDELIELDMEIEYLLKRMNHITPRNMVGGLINRKCVCAGYAEIVRNVFACLGIEVKYVSGVREDEEVGHAWNQIKLDGVWYNMDLTWDRDRIVEGIKPLWLLRDDTSFNNMYIDADTYEVENGHGIYSEYRSDEVICDDDIKPYEVQRFIETEWSENSQKEWLYNIAKILDIHQVRSMGDMIIASKNKNIAQSNPRRVFDYDKS